MAAQTESVRATLETEPETRSVWEFDPTHSSAEFAVRHMMLSTVRGSFKNLRGTIVLDAGEPDASHVEAEIDATSIDTGVADRDAHLRSPDFFDVAAYPTLTFRSRKIEAEPAIDAGTLHGDLTIHGVTRPVTLDVTYLGELKDPWGNLRRGYAAETTLNRKDFGMTWNMVLDTGGVLVGDKVKVTLSIEAVRKASA